MQKKNNAYIYCCGLRGDVSVTLVLAPFIVHEDMARGRCDRMAADLQASHTVFFVSFDFRLCPPSSISSTLSRAFIVSGGRGSFPWQHSGNRLANSGSRDMESSVDNELLWLASFSMNAWAPRTLAINAKKIPSPYASQRFREL